MCALVEYGNKRDYRDPSEKFLRIAKEIGRMEASYAASAAVAPTLPPITLSPSYLLRMFREYQSNTVIMAHYNFTGKLKENKYRDGLKPEAIAFLIICLLIVVENAIVLVAIWKNKKIPHAHVLLAGQLDAL